MNTQESTPSREKTNWHLTAYQCLISGNEQISIREEPVGLW